MFKDWIYAKIFTVTFSLVTGCVYRRLEVQNKAIAQNCIFITVWFLLLTHSSDTEYVPSNYTYIYDKFPWVNLMFNNDNNSKQIWAYYTMHLT